MGLWLNDDELFELTAYRQREKQRRELARQGIKFRVRRDGMPLVERAQFGGEAPRRKKEPDWSVLERAS